jgi:hypothetical protein
VVREVVPEFGQERAVSPDRIFFVSSAFGNQKKVDGLENFHTPPPVFDGIMLMLIYRESQFSQEIR